MWKLDPVMLDLDARSVVTGSWYVVTEPHELDE